MTETTQQTDKSKTSIAADRVALVYYTDPLCCWSWALQPQLDQLQTELGKKLSIRYCMGGLIPDWNAYYDETNSISRPIQMGPLWMEVHHRTGIPLHDRIWMTDPPASSYPACIAVKSAGLQGEEYEHLMLHILREEIMLKGRNIAKTAVLLDAAERLPHGFDQAQFRKNLLSISGIEAFREDLNEIALQHIRRFPSLKITIGTKSVLITGYRKYEVLRKAIESIA